MHDRVKKKKKKRGAVKLKDRGGGRPKKKNVCGPKGVTQYCTYCKITFICS